MLARIRKSFITKIIAGYLALFLLLEGVFTANIALANSSGPGQAEFNASSMQGMVNPFTGDFHYSIPLMTVPGPNGSYPITLDYSSSGISMETDASWVGLGWNLNAGSISRNMKGLPDDFNGDAVSKQYNIKEIKHVAVDASVSITDFSADEIFGLDVSYTGLSPNGSLQIYNNSYTGKGFMFGFGMDAQVKATIWHPLVNVAGVSGGFNFTYDSQKGLGFSTNSNLNLLGFKSKNSLNLSSGVGLEGFSNVGFTSGAGTYKSLNKVRYIPASNFPVKGNSFIFGLSFGTSNSGGKFIDNTGSFFSSTQDLYTSSESFPSYGYLYSENNNGSNFALMDFNRENDVPVNENIPALPVPVFLADDYVVSGNLNMSFRAYRGDIGILKSEKRQVNSSGDNMGAEVGTNASSLHMGVDATTISGTSSSGNWQDNKDQVNVFNFKSKSTSDPLFENYFFKASGELTESDAAFLAQIGGYGPNAFDISLDNEKPFVHSRLYNYAPYTSQINQRTTREARETSISPFTVRETEKNENYINRVYHIYNENQSPLEDGSGSQFAFPSVAKDHHIGEIKILTPDGTQHQYGIASYNTEHHEVMYSVTDPNTNKYTNTARISTSQGDASTSNNEGEDNFYQKTTLPAYVQNYLISAITSHDYVDLTGNGVSDDDFGFFAKFNYTKLYNDFQWRFPYAQSFYHKNHYSNTADDKANYQFGKKEVFYLNSVETKTHIAIFEVCEREDGLEAPGEFNNSTAENYLNANPNNVLKKQRALKKITLYNKSNPDKPLQTVEFFYDYSLCSNLESNSGKTTGLPSCILNNTNKGKLTLKKVVIKNLENNKGDSSPYEFTYSTTNPAYSALQIDRWGTYRQNESHLEIDWDERENPYQIQGDYDKDGVVSSSDKMLLDQNVSAWCMNKINLPSGGEINVQYESDDYGYVQDKQAQAVMRIVGTSKESQVDFDVDGGIVRDNVRIYFQLPVPILASSTTAEVQNEIRKYIAGLDLVYFKSFQKLKLENDDDILTHSFDYVDGYAEIVNDNPNDVGVDDDETIGGYFTVGYITVKKLDYLLGAFKVHPFRKAGWQYLRLERPDLNGRSADQFSQGSFQIATALLLAIPNILTGLTGYYNSAFLKGWNNKILLETDNGSIIDPNDNILEKPSFLRLNIPNFKKTGGGNRVAKITWKDNWGEGTQELGQIYEYKLADGKSSGVAASEPYTGNDDNTLNMPRYYFNDQNIVYKNEFTFLDEPWNESNYPAPSVGYSRVVIKNINADIDVNLPGEDINKNNTGVTVREFYTAKDFPVISYATEMKSEISDDFDFGIFNFKNTTNSGYSQGFYCELNDMHGKEKAVSVYKYNADMSLPPVSRTEYFYTVDNNDPKRLKNQVTGVPADGITQEVTLGECYEFYVDMREHYEKSVSTSIEGNIFMQALNYFPIPTGWYYTNTNEGMFRSVVTNKIVHKNGILKKVVNYSEGSVVEAENLAFDPQTGDVVASSSTNSFKNPVYSYTYPAHWSYASMNGAYKNTGAEFLLTHTGISGAPFTNAPQFFVPGDEVQITTNGSGDEGKVFYVKSVTAVSVVLQDKDAAYPSFSNQKVKIIRSGNRNLQSIKSGELVSLQHPILERRNSHVAIFNTYISGQTFYDPTNIVINDIKGCEANALSDYQVRYAASTLIEFFNLGTDPGVEDDCDASVTFTVSLPSSNLTQYTITSFNPANNQIVFKHNPTNTNYIGTWSDTKKCFTTCLDVLHASAVEFSEDSWVYNYKDAGDPVISASNDLLRTATVNDFRYGKRGIWRMKRGNVFQVDRDQTGTAPNFNTRIDKDGEYHEFTFFDWSGLTDNYQNRWNWNQEITRYNPYGYAVETKDRLEIFSSKIYGYNNSVSTATAANSSYMEMAFDAFEDYTLNNYDFSGHGHFNFTNLDLSEIVLSTAQSHTGKVSATVRSNDKIVYSCTVGASNPDYFTPLNEKKYIVSAWFKNNNSVSVPQIKLYNGNINIAPILVYDQYPEIEGWKKLEVVFEIPDNITNIRFEFGFNDNTPGFLDDVRVNPFEGVMATSVYDPLTLWKIADLDNQNFATIYEYDEEGAVVQVKKETVNGLVTLSTGRSNIKRQ